MKWVFNVVYVVDQDSLAYFQRYHSLDHRLYGLIMTRWPNNRRLDRRIMARLHWKQLAYVSKWEDAEQRKNNVRRLKIILWFCLPKGFVEKQLSKNKKQQMVVVRGLWGRLVTVQMDTGIRSARAGRMYYHFWWDGKAGVLWSYKQCWRIVNFRLHVLAAGPLLYNHVM